MIRHILVLSGFFHRPYPIRLVMAAQFHFQSRLNLYYRSQQINFIFGVDQTYTISHAVVLFGFNKKVHLL